MITRSRQYLRALRYARAFPIVVPLARELGIAREGMDLCDGRKTLSEIAHLVGSRRQILRWHDDGHVILWPRRLRERSPLTITRIILSPHPDDAALSLGAMMLAGEGVHILTIFGQSIWQRLAPPLEPDRIVRLRAAEEGLMARLAGASLELLDLPEALLRGHSMQSVFQPPNDEAAIRQQVLHAISQTARRYPAAQWFVPLGVGGHVDHLICRDAALEALGNRALLYEELPYAAEASPFPRHGCIPLAASRSTLRLKMELLRVYASQLTWSRIAPLGTYARRLGHRFGHHGVERCWPSGF